MWHFTEGPRPRALLQINKRVPVGDEVARVNAYVCVCERERESTHEFVCLLEGVLCLRELQTAGPETH